MNKFLQNKIFNTFHTISTVLLIAVLLGFTPMLNPTPGNWYQQFVTPLNGRQINDITFTDSLNGYIITNKLSSTDSSLILKTTTGGNSWFISYVDTGSYDGFTKIKFINNNVGFVGGFITTNFNYFILKTTNSGISWFHINSPFQHVVNDMYVLNEDSMWIADQTGSFGGVFFTSTGGANWTVQYQGNNPGHIYMYNRNMGFISPPSLGALYRTTNSGQNWTQVSGADGFIDIKFVDSLTGWKSMGTMKKTTDGGLAWTAQVIPSGGNIISSNLNRFSVINRDTLWGIGGQIIIGSQTRGTVFRTTNGGINWLFQIPDTGIQIIVPYAYIEFTNNKCGWAYTLGLMGDIHTTSGGDPGWLTDTKQISNKITKKFKLYQNYPNPFNPFTKIRYLIKSNAKREMSNVRINVYEISGKFITSLVNESQNAGIYEVQFDGSGYSSGIYFYELTVDGNLIDTKKMILLK